MLYPLKFKPILKDRIWGGEKLKTKFGKKTGKIAACGESWEISGIEDNVSVVLNGYLKDNSLQNLIEVYMGDLVGEKVYQQFGIEFPLLIKFIDAKDILSLQVHPNDELANKRHNAYGKTEMWYIIESDEGAEIISGFSRNTSKEEFSAQLKNKTVEDLLNTEKTKQGDVYFLPAGRIHAIGAGNFLAEIQQTSDITYRVYDWERTDNNGNPRELHTELALDAMDYNTYNNYKTVYHSELNQTNNILSCRYFTCNILQCNHQIQKDFFNFDTFVIYMCVEGKCKIEYNNDLSESLCAGECILVPAVIKDFLITPDENTKLLEVFIA